MGLLRGGGPGSRFCSDKLQHTLPHGVAIAAQAARHLRMELSRVVAVVRPDCPELTRSVSAEGCEVVVCENAAEGMGASLACAARAAGRADAYLIALADMPFVRRSTIAALRDALAAGAPLVAPYFHARRGHPVGISGAYYEALLASKGDEGARRVLQEEAAKLMKIPVGDPGVIRDIDTPQDLLPPVRV